MRAREAGCAARLAPVEGAPSRWCTASRRCTTSPREHLVVVRRQGCVTVSPWGDVTFAEGRCDEHPLRTRDKPTNAATQAERTISGVAPDGHVSLVQSPFVVRGNEHGLKSECWTHVAVDSVSSNCNGIHCGEFLRMSIWQPRRQDRFGCSGLTWFDVRSDSCASRMSRAKADPP